MGRWVSGLPIHQTAPYLWHCTCDTPTLLGNGECIACHRAPEWATLAAVKTYRAERSDAPLGDG